MTPRGQFSMARDNIYKSDFEWRARLWSKVHENEEAFWRGDVIGLCEGRPPPDAEHSTQTFQLLWCERAEGPATQVHQTSG